MKMHCVHYSGTVKPFNHQRREVSWLSSECVSVQSLTCFCERPPTKKKSAAESACVLWLLMRGYLKTNSLSAACTSLLGGLFSLQCSARWQQLLREWCNSERRREGGGACVRGGGIRRQISTVGVDLVTDQLVVKLVRLAPRAGWELLLKARRGMMQQICNDCNTHSRAWIIYLWPHKSGSAAR